jgi:hypothetical protein
MTTATPRQTAIASDPDRQAIREAAHLMRQWRLEEAYAVLSDTVRSRVSQMSVLRRMTVVRMLADASRELGDTDLATILLGPLLRECLHRFGGRHPATLRTTVSYALLLHQFGRDHDADLILRQLLTDLEIGLTRPLARETITATALRTLIAVRHGRAAVHELRDCVADCRIVVGPDHPHTVRMTIALADAYQRAGDTADARAFLEAALSDVLTRHGTHHPLVAHLGHALSGLAETPAEAPPVGAPSPPPPSRRTQSSRRSWRWPSLVAGATGAAVVLAIATLPAITAATRPHPASWVQPPMDPRPHNIRIHTTGSTATVTWTSPNPLGRPTIIVTVGGLIRATETLAPATAAFAVDGIGPGIVCAVITVTNPNGPSGTAAACAGQPA